MSTLAGGGSVGGIIAGATNGVGVIAKFSGPRGIVIDSTQRVFVADAANNQIRSITPTSKFTEKKLTFE